MQPQEKAIFLSNMDSESKDPAFLFYSNDWLQGTAKLFPAEKGVYADLLAHHHQDGFLPTNLKRLAKMVGLSDSEFLEIWEGIKQKFYEEDGKFYNRKLVSVISGRNEYGEMRSIIGTFGQLLKKESCSEEIKLQIRKKFKFKDFLEVDKANLSTLLSKFISKCLTSCQAIHENVNEIENVNEDYYNNIMESEKFENKFLVPDMLKTYVNSNPTHPQEINRDFKPLQAISIFIHKQLKLNGNNVENKGLIIKKWEQLCSVIADDNFYKLKSLSVISNQIQEIYQIEKNGKSAKTNTKSTTTRFNAGAIDLLNDIKGGISKRG